MEEDKVLKRLLKWAGVAALFAIPFILILRKWNAQEEGLVAEDNSDIFASELED